MKNLIRHRHSIRLPGYDYTQPGAYFITITTHNRESLFGQIANGVMTLNVWGEIARAECRKTAKNRPYVELDEFCVMPNHIHGIIIINDIPGRGTARRAPTFPVAPMNPVAITEQFGKPVPQSIPTIVRAYKSAVTKRINEINHTPATPIWQRNYYEHIIRNDIELTRTREYIINNPLLWGEDTENSAR